MSNRYERDEQSFRGQSYASRNGEPFDMSRSDMSYRRDQEQRDPRMNEGRWASQGMRWSEDMNRMNAGDMGSSENRYDRWRNEERNDPRMSSSPWQSDRSRDERWGMGNMREESDRFRAASEMSSGGRSGSMLGGQWRYQGGQAWQGGDMGGQRDWRAPMYGAQGVGAYDDRSFGGAYGSGGYGAYGQGWYGQGEPRFGRGGERASSWAGSRGPFFGRGPKGYKRSDDRIKEDVYERLSWGHLDASEVEVQVRDGEVTLMGSVPSRDMKRTAEDLVEEILGVNEVANQLRVKREGAMASGDRPMGSMGETTRKSSMSSTTQPQRS